MKRKFIRNIMIAMTSLGLTCGTLSSCGTQGEQGIQGEVGEKGENGKDGTGIYTGSGAPKSSDGKVGDLYVDSESGNLYCKGESGWIKTGNIKGASGNDGVNGKDGVSIVGISKTSTSDNVDIYTITYSNGSTSIFTVTNGVDGKPGVQGEKGEDGHAPTITIGSNGNWYVDGVDTGYPATGPKGDAGVNGADGISIVSVVKTDSNGEIDTYTITYSDGNTSTFTIINGKDGNDGHTPVVAIGSDGYWYVDDVNTGVKAKGDDGDDGKGISKINKTSSDGNVDTYTITYSDGSTSTFIVTNGVDGKTPYIGDNGHWWIGDTDTGVNASGDKGDAGEKGDKGDPGTNGSDGKNGVSVVNSYIDENGDLICEMSDGTTINAGHVKNVTKHTINFYVDDDLVYKTTVEDGMKMSAPDRSYTAGYTVNCWNSKEDGGYRWLFSAYTVTSDMNLYADFTYNDYSITYVDEKYGTSLDTLTVTYDKDYTLATIDNKTGWTFNGWKTKEGVSFENEGTYRIASDLTLYADWVANQYTVTLDPNNGTVSQTEVTVTYDLQYELPTPERINYSFLGWYDSSDKKVSSKATWKGTEDVTYTAKWTNVQNTYVFDAGDGTCDVDSMVIGWEDAYELPTPTAPSGGVYEDGTYYESYYYSFVGWYLDGMNIPLSGTKWTYSNNGGTLVAHYNRNGDDNSLKYGIYPQTRVSDEALITALNTLNTTESNGWCLYNGDYYAKLTAKPDSTSYKFNDGTTIIWNTEYWFKCEPINWKILESNDGEYKLVSSVILDAHCYYSSKDSRTIDGKTIYSNNYKHSDIRAWLNGDFYNTAFSLGNSYIQTTEVDNSAATTVDSTNEYICENTYDKVYLLSYQDYKNATYFADEEARKCKVTDYAKANGCYVSTSWYSTDCGLYLTRSPSDSCSYEANYILNNGHVFSSAEVYRNFYSVRPAMTVKFERNESNHHNQG